MSERRHRAFEVARPRLLANFRPEPWEREKRVPRYKTREGMSEAHLANVRAIRICLACGQRGAVDPHHLQNGIHNRGFGMRGPDAHVVPLCRRCHTELHALGSRREPEFFADHGVTPPMDQHFVALRLWGNRGSSAAMTVVVESHVAARRCRNL